MKNHEELMTEIFEDEAGEDSETLAYVAVDSTVYAVLEYIDDISAQFAGHYAVLGQIMNILRANIKQLGRTE